MYKRCVYDSIGRAKFSKLLIDRKFDFEKLSSIDNRLIKIKDKYEYFAEITGRCLMQ